MTSRSQLYLTGGAALLLLGFMSKSARAALPPLPRATKDRLRAVLPFLRAAASRHGVPLDILVAVAYQESRFNPGATNLTASDLARGGAWGLMQMTVRTAEDLGYGGEPEGLLDIATNTDLAGKLLARLKRSLGSWEEAVRAYNGSGPRAQAYRDEVLGRRGEMAALLSEVGVAVAGLGWGLGAWSGDGLAMRQVHSRVWEPAHYQPGRVGPVRLLSGGGRARGLTGVGNYVAA